jgi:hypothetical protein
MDLSSLFADMRRQTNFTCGDRGASEDEIDHIETTLEVKLPESYVTFLKTFRYAWWFGHAIYGVSEDEELDALTYTIEARQEDLPEGFLPLPKDGIVVERYGGGGYYFLHGADSLASPGTVSLLLDETFRHEAESWESFEAFLAYLLGNA